LDMLKFIMREEKAISSESYLDKLMQIYDTLTIRFGMMLVGSPLAGKSTMIQYLIKTINRLSIGHKSEPEKQQYNMIEMAELNPKSIMIEQLYGRFDPLTQTWSDGLASKILRDFVSRN